MWSGGSEFETRAASPATIKELEPARLEEFVRRRWPGLPEGQLAEEVLVQLGLAVRSGPQLAPTVLALYLFGRHPQLCFPQWGVVAVRLDGTSLAAPVRARVDPEGPLERLLEQSLDFLRSQVWLAAGGTGCELPEAAVREALVNALIHRDLRSGGRIALRLFDDRLEVYSPGASVLPQPATLQELLTDGGVSLPRNPLLADAARRLGLGEQLGRGLPVLRASMAALTRQPVELRCTATEVVAVLPTAYRKQPPS